jgi:hypothetical protein
MTKFILTMMLLVPHFLFANTECWLEEYPDHYVAECKGDKITDPVVTPTSISNHSANSEIPTIQSQTTDPIQTSKMDPLEETISMSVEPSYRPTRMSKARLKAAIIARSKILATE